MRKVSACFSLFLLAIVGGLYAQQTVGLFQYDPATSDGYTLIAPNASTNTYLIDNCGREVHNWTSAYNPGNVVQLSEDGSLMRTCRIANANFTAGGLGGRIQVMDWNSNVTWYYEYTSANYSQHHDATLLPNGNFLFITWEAKTRAEAIAEGRDSSILGQRIWPDALIEVQPTTPGSGNIVWEWHAWDHLVQAFDNTRANFGVVADHPELINLNYYRPGSTNFRDWLHSNAVAYNPTLDQIAISIHNFDEIWVIDHSTTTAEAASHSGGNSGKGGDLLYRFGNPATYDRGTSSDHLFFGMHDVQWVPAGDQYAGQMMIFNNGLARPAGNFSTVEIWQPPVDVAGNYTILASQPFGPTATTWTYQDNPPTNFYSQIISSAQRLAGNHTLICEGNPGRVREIDSSGTMIWEYVNPVQATGPLNQGDPVTNNGMFRAYKYAPNYSGLAGHVLTPGAQLEGNPLALPSNCLTSGIAPAHEVRLAASPNPFEAKLRLEVSGTSGGQLEIYDAHGRLVAQRWVSDGTLDLDANGWSAGIYLIKLQGAATTLRVLKLE